MQGIAASEIGGIVQGVPSWCGRDARNAHSARRSPPDSEKTCGLVPLGVSERMGAFPTTVGHVGQERQCPGGITGAEMVELQRAGEGEGLAVG